MAHQKSDKGIPLKSGMYLRNGQMIGTADTIATASTKSKTAVAREADACVIAPRGDNLALTGAAKNSGAAPVKPGMRSRRGE